MNLSASEFEQHLKQLQPTSADELLPDTFYQAGWDACQSQSPVRIAGQRPRRTWASFGTGVLCGVLVSVGLTAWQLSMNQPDRSSFAASRSVGRADKTVAGRGSESDQRINKDEHTVAVAVSSVEWQELVAGFSPWATADDESVNLTPLAARPLSPAARYHWSSIVVAEPESRGDGSVDTSSTPFNADAPLRYFPATERVFEELL